MDSGKKTVDGTMYAVLGIVLVAALILVGTVSCSNKTATPAANNSTAAGPGLVIVGERVASTSQEDAPPAPNSESAPPAPTTRPPAPAASGGGGGGGSHAGSSGGSTTPTPSPQPAIRAGDTVTVDVTTSGAADLSGAQLDVVYDARVLQFVGVTEGPFLDAGQAGDAMLLSTYTVKSGTVSNIIVLRVAQPGVSGSGTLCTLRFTAIADGEPAVNLQNVLLSNSQAQNLPNTLHAAVQIS